MFRIEEGTLPKEAYWIKVLPEQQLPLVRLLSESNLPTWNEFQYQERCEKGLAISTMTQQERRALFEQWENLYIEAYSD